MTKKNKYGKTRRVCTGSGATQPGRDATGHTVTRDARALAGGEAASELSVPEYDRLLKGRIRELEAVMEKYCHCRHASIDCFCTVEARAVMFKER